MNELKKEISSCSKCGAFRKTHINTRIYSRTHMHDNILIDIWIWKKNILFNKRRAHKHYYLKKKEKKIDKLLVDANFKCSFIR